MILLPLLALPLGGCVAAAIGSAAVSAVTLPVKVAGAAVDKMTTSQAEADRNYGRKMRKQEEREGREAKKRAKRERRERDRD